MLKKVYFTTAFIIFGLFVPASDRLVAAEPVDHEAVLSPFVNDDTLAAAYIDFSSFNAANIGELVSSLPKLPQAAQAEMLGAMMFSGLAKNFQDAGGHALYVVVGLGDVHLNGGPVVIAATKPGKNPHDVAQMIGNTIRQFASAMPESGARSLAQELDVQRKGEVVLAGTKSTVARYARLQSSPRSELIAPLAKQIGDGAAVAIVFCPGADYRRVSRELWPVLPGAWRRYGAK